MSAEPPIVGALAADRLTGTIAMMMPIFVFVFVSALMLVGYNVYESYNKSKQIERRLGAASGENRPNEPDIIDLLPPEAEGWWKDLLPQFPGFHKVIEQANLKIDPGQLMMFSLALGGIGALVPFVIGWSYFWMPIMFILLAPLPFFYVLQVRKARFKKFAAQLCEALELVARALRAGHSLASGMNAVAEEMPDPISTEFKRVYEEQNLGKSLEEAMRNLGERIPNLDLKFFVTAVIIQRQTGGDLAEILDKIGYVIRERFKILGMVAALTGEGRMSGVVLIALPFILVVTLMAINYDYVSMLWTHRLGRMLSAGAIVSMALGAWLINKIVDIKV